VFVSDDLGTSWQAFNQGLVGGFLDTQLFLDDLVSRGDSLYAATSGAGVYVRNLTGGTWQPFGAAFEPSQASNVNSITLGGNRLLATGGANGQVLRRDPGEPDWTISNLDNQGLHPGLEAQTAAWNGFGWVVGTNLGVFRSTGGQEPWTRFDPGVGTIRLITFATRPAAVRGRSSPTWSRSSRRAAMTGPPGERGDAARRSRRPARGERQRSVRRADDGLWRHPIGTASAPPPWERGERRPVRGRGAAAVGGQARPRLELPTAGDASIEVFDAQGRLAIDRVGGWWSAGPHEVTLDSPRA
jgi:hypothetical protein